MINDLYGMCVHMYLDDIAANEHGIFLANEVSKVDKGRARPWRTSQGQNVWLIVLDVLLDVHELLDTSQSVL